MAQLAIKGHATRGREVINTLKMLGGKNSRNLLGDVSSSCYYIDSTGKIDYEHYSYFDDDMPFTLEKFLEKFPYKVGDKVKAWVNDYYGVFDIQDIRWSNLANEVGYKIHGHWYSVRNLQPYKEAPMYLNEKANKQAEEIKKILEPVKKIIEEKDKAKAPDLKGEDYSFRRFGYKIPNGYEFECVRNNEIILKPKQPQYPKTFEECQKILKEDVPPMSELKLKSDRRKLVHLLEILLTCYDAYRKIAGEQMGLGKPWEPDYLNPTKEIRYFIFCTGITIEKGQGLFPTNKILIFPTEEMRDAFYENFKELIELCKELL
jgi:hypothetical protein